jgi:hypothetical protein
MWLCQLGNSDQLAFLISCTYLHFFYYFAAYSLHDIGRFVLNYLHCLFTRK